MVKHPKAFWTLWQVIHQRLVPRLSKDLPPDLLNPVFGLPESKRLSNRTKPSANERYWIDWFREFSEIGSSVDRLNQALVYLARFPENKTFRFHGLSEADWLRYHIEAYLQETYVLYSRLRRFLRKVEKVAIASSDRVGITSARDLDRTVTASLANVVKIRGGHVHEYRFDDKELRDLDVLVLVTKHGRLRPLRPFRHLKYIEALEKWRKQLWKNNRETLNLCAKVFEDSTKILVRNEPVRG
jgi:hypothetical protein